MFQQSRQHQGKYDNIVINQQKYKCAKYRHRLIKVSFSKTVNYQRQVFTESFLGILQSSCEKRPSRSISKFQPCQFEAVGCCSSEVRRLPLCKGQHSKRHRHHIPPQLLPWGCHNQAFTALAPGTSSTQHTYLVGTQMALLS